MHSMDLGETALKLILPSFVLTEACHPEDPLATQRDIRIGNDSVGYAWKPVAPLFSSTRYRELYRWNQFPVVLNANGSPWRDANLFLLDQIESSHNPNMTTYHGKAYALVYFKRFLDERQIDYLQFPTKKRGRPTYAYRNYLQESVDLGEISVATARGRISSVKQFYSWLINEGICRPQNLPWKEIDTSARYKDAKGFTQHKQISSSDLKIKGSTAPNSIRAVVDGDGELRPIVHDGGKLKPLNIQEQKALIDSLKDLNNWQMTLIHYLALFTGARIQTILTLRVKHALLEVDERTDLIPFLVGPKVGIDTKGNKNLTIFIPIWLYQRLKVYVNSPNAVARRERSGKDDEDQYLFLTRDGNPLYLSKLDMMIFNPADEKRYIQQGTNVRQFMLRRVIPLIRHKLSKEKWSYQFHDLRATFGMNQLNHQMRLVAQGKSTPTKALKHVQGLMAHESLTTTEGYLNYHHDLAQVRHLQHQYEGYLKDLTARAMEAQYD